MIPIQTTNYVTQMSATYSFCVVILHTNTSFLYLPEYFLQIPNLSDTGWFQILKRGPYHKKL
jgi:hypothetical protein